MILTTILVFCILFNPPGETMNLIHFFGDLSIAFRLDGLGSVFTAMVAFLWPLATLYSFEYMKHEENEDKFYCFFLLSFASLMGMCY